VVESWLASPQAKQDNLVFAGNTFFNLGGVIAPIAVFTDGTPQKVAVGCQSLCSLLYGGLLAGSNFN